MRHNVRMAGGSGRGVAHHVPSTPAARRHCWVTGPDRDLHPGLIVAWERRESGWFAQVAYVVEADGALVTQWLASELLTPIG